MSLANHCGWGLSRVVARCTSTALIAGYGYLSMVRTRAARRRDAPSLVSDTWSHAASFLGAADLFRVEAVSRGHRAVVGSLTKDVWRGAVAAASPQLSELCRASNWSPRTFSRAWLQRWRAAGPRPYQVDEKPMMCVPWDREQVAQADGPHVVLVVDGHAEIMAPDDPSSGHPLAHHRLLSHLTIDKIYPDDDIMDLTTSCFLIAQDGSSIVELWDNATAYEYSGGLTFEHGGIELVAIYSDGVSADTPAQGVMAAIRKRDYANASFPADVGFATLMAYLHFDDEDEPHRIVRAEISWRIHEHDNLFVMDDVTGVLAEVLGNHPATHPDSSAVFQEDSCAWT